MRNVFDLKKFPEFLPEYVNLRNAYCDLLLTQPVVMAESIQWLKTTTAEIRLIEESLQVLGVVLLYVDREGEVALFTRQSNKGIGTNLLEIVDDLAYKLQLPSIWAWVRENNNKAAYIFEKCGYIYSGKEVREYNDETIYGVRYTKIFEKVRL